MHHHKALGQRAGLSEEQIEALDRYEDSDAFDDLEKTVVRFAEQFTKNIKVDEKVIQRLKDALPPEHLVKLAAAVGQANWTNRFNETFRVELP